MAMNLFRPFHLSVLIVCLGMAFRTSAEAPVNDLFANRIAVSGDSFELSGNVAEAGVEPGEPAAGIDDFRSLWWTWSTNRNGYLLPSYWRGRGTIFHGDTLGELAAAQMENAPVEGGSVDYLTVEAGVPQAIRLAGWMTNCFSWVSAVPPVFTNRCWVNGPDVSARYRFIPDAGDLFADRITVQATAPEFLSPPGSLPPETGEPMYADIAGKGRWWSWTAPVTARYGLLGPYSGMSVFRGDTLTNLVLAAHATRSSDELIIHVWGGFSRLSTFTARAGETFAIRVDTLTNAPANAWIRGGLKRLERPDNDDFDQAFTYSIVSNPSPMTASLFGATEELDEPAGLKNSIWWRWMPQQSGVQVLARFRGDVRSEEEHVRFTIFSGTTLTGLVRRAVLEPLKQRVAFPVTAGETLYIAADAPAISLAPGSFTVVEGAPNDDFARALPIEPREDPEIAFLKGASFEEGENESGAGSVWYQCVAPADGQFFVRAENAYARIWSGSSLTNLVLRATAAEPGALTAIPVAKGERLSISVHPPDYYLGNANLWLDFSSARLLGPVGNFVAVPGTDRIDAEISAPSSETEPPVVGIGWFLFPSNPRSVPPSPVVRGNSATWENVLPDLWRLEVRLTNAFGRVLTFGKATVRLRPSNDDFSGALPVGSVPHVASPTLATGAGAEIGEPPFAHDEDRTNSLWWYWTADRAGEAVAVARYIDVFTGDRLENLVPIAGPFPSFVRFSVTPGVRYNFRVRESIVFFGPQIPLELNWKLPGDDFGDRVSLPFQAGQFLVPSGLATREPDEPASSQTSVATSLWWTWTAPTNGMLAISSRPLITNAYLIPPRWRAFSGGAWPALTEIERLPFFPPEWYGWSSLWQVKAGETLELSAALASQDSFPQIARLDFWADPTAGNFGTILKVRENLSAEGIAFPLRGNAGDRVVIEKSDDLRTWYDHDTHDFVSESTYWFHHVSSPAYFRMRWARTLP